jgi:hypothetical protein
MKCSVKPLERITPTITPASSGIIIIESIGIFLDKLDWLDEASGRLTRVVIGYPASWGELEKIQKHIRYALNNDKTTDLHQYVKDTRGRMTAMMVKYPEFEEHFRPVLEKPCE